MREADFLCAGPGPLGTFWVLAVPTKGSQRGVESVLPPPPTTTPGVERKGSWEEGSGRGLFQPLVHLVAIGTPGDR